MTDTPPEMLLGETRRSLGAAAAETTAFLGFWVYVVGSVTHAAAAMVWLKKCFYSDDTPGAEKAFAMTVLATGILQIAASNVAVASVMFPRGGPGASFDARKPMVALNAPTLVSFCWASVYMLIPVWAPETLTLAIVHASAVVLQACFYAAALFFCTLTA